jgi:hypothetical protein
MMSTATTCPIACTGPQVNTTISANILRIDKQLRSSLSILFMYSVVLFATLGIIVMVIFSMSSMYRQWRLMAAAPPGSVDVTIDPFTAVGDDEVYQSDVALAASGPSIGDRINAGVNALEQTYSAYNKQIASHAINVLKQPDLDDRIDRQVLDRKHDNITK